MADTLYRPSKDGRSFDPATVGDCLKYMRAVFEKGQPMSFFDQFPGHPGASEYAQRELEDLRQKGLAMSNEIAEIRAAVDVIHNALGSLEERLAALEAPASPAATDNGGAAPSEVSAPTPESVPSDTPVAADTQNVPTGNAGDAAPVAAPADAVATDVPADPAPASDPIPAGDTPSAPPADVPVATDTPSVA